MSEKMDDFQLKRLNHLLEQLENRELTGAEKVQKKILKQIKRWEKEAYIYPLFMDLLGLRPFEITYYFEDHGRMCVIVRRNDAYDGFYHNGYVECHPKNQGKPLEAFETSIESVDLSEAGPLDQYAPLPDDLQGKWYFGFHTFLLSSQGCKYRWYGSFQNTLACVQKLVAEMTAKKI